MMEPSGQSVANSGDEQIPVSRREYETMRDALKQYQLLYGELPDRHADKYVETLELAAETEVVSEKPQEQQASDTIMAILSQDESALQAETLDDMAEGILALGNHDVIRHYGFKRAKTGHH